MKVSKIFSSRYLIVLLLLIVQNISFAQDATNMLKYWKYRHRLNNYFVIPGEKYGESQIIAIRNKIYSDGDNPDMETSGPESRSYKQNVDYGQHGKYQGLYISVLATEYYLLKKNGQFDDALRTEQELLWALNAVKVYCDEKAEDFWGLSSMPDKFNGFFIRGNVPCDFFNDVQNENLIS
jgi:hypothetical protein